MTEAEQLAARSVGFDSALRPKWPSCCIRSPGANRCRRRWPPTRLKARRHSGLAGVLPPSDVQLCNQSPSPAVATWRWPRTKHAGFNMALRTLAFHPANLPPARRPRFLRLPCPAYAQQPAGSKPAAAAPPGKSPAQPHPPRRPPARTALARVVLLTAEQRSDQNCAAPARRHQPRRRAETPPAPAEPEPEPAYLREAAVRRPAAARRQPAFRPGAAMANAAPEPAPMPEPRPANAAAMTPPAAAEHPPWKNPPRRRASKSRPRRLPLHLSPRRRSPASRLLTTDAAPLFSGNWGRTDCRFPARALAPKKSCWRKTPS